MEKTKIGLNVTVVAALTYLLFLLSGYTVGLLAVGYVVLCESNIWLRKNAVSALLVTLCFSALNLLVGFVPELINLLYSLLRIFNVHFYLDFVDSVFSFFMNALDLLRTVTFVLLAVLALQKKTVSIKLFDKLFD